MRNFNLKKMEQTIVIKPSKHISINTTLKAAYMHPEKLIPISLTMDKRIVFGELKDTDKVFIYKFGEYNRAYTNRVSLDADKELKKKAEDEKMFWSKHPHIKHIEGDNKYLRNDLFEMEVLEDTQNKQNKEDREWLEIQNTVNNLGEKNRYNLCFFFGGNPTKMSADAIWSDLIGRDGRLMYKDNRTKFFEIMGGDKKQEVIDRTIIKKAIHFGIIITESNKYWTKQRDLLGMNEDDIYLHYKDNPAFEFIKQEVAGLDVNVPKSPEDKKTLEKKSV